MVRMPADASTGGKQPVTAGQATCLTGRARWLKMAALALGIANIAAAGGAIATIASATRGVATVIFDGVFAIALISDLLACALLHLVLDVKRDRRAARINWFLSAFLASLPFTIAFGFARSLVIQVIQDTASIYHAWADLGAVLATCCTFTFATIACTMLWRCENLPARDRPVRDDPGWQWKPNASKAWKAFGFGWTVLFLCMGLLVAFIFVSGGRDVLSWIAGNLAFTMLAVIVPSTTSAARLVPRTRTRGNKTLVAGIMITGAIIAGVNAAPLLATTGMVPSIEAQFTEAFGPGWQDRIPAAERASFRPAPYSLLDNVYAVTNEPVDETRDIEYAVHMGRSLKLDWYAPRGTNGTSGPALPVVIAIHGGSWRYMDKGIENLFPTSRYIASKGYIVVDIQYGLLGDGFTFADMIAQIGNVTTFLAGKVPVLHANVSQAFLLGRSAGAHLSLVAGLGYTNPYFAGTFHPAFKCLGIVPFYPPTNLTWLDASDEDLVGVPASEFPFYNPVDLVAPGAPPVLAFHGTSDKLVPIQQSLDLQARVRASGGTCITGTMPFGGHAFDIFGSYAHNQACVYYIERFLALARLA